MQQIFVHGLGQTPASWNKTIIKLGTVEDSVCPNLAELAQGNEVTYKNIYAVFSDFCNKIEGSIDLCGLSLGGVLALNYAIDYPEKVNSLILIAAQYKMPKKLLRFQNILFRFMPKAMFQQMGFGKKDFLQLCKSMMELDFSKELSKVDCPTLVLCGEKDSANKSASVELADNLQNAELHVIIGVGHEVNTEASEELAKVIKGFYNRVK